MPGTDSLQAALSDRYTIIRHIGEGGMATVYLAKDLKHDREVALKVLRPNLSAVIGTERFLEEVRIAARLDHPHILTLIDSGSADGVLFYVLPFVRGESLRAKLNREKQLGADEALSITKQVASALDYAHNQGVVHRDIKPENILLQEGEAVLADFGIALAVKEAGGNRLTETGLSLGTPQYMSPEQATGDRALDRRSDIYSLGAVYYEMMAGEPPVTGATAQVVIAKLLTERPMKLSVVRDTVPPGVERAVEKSLAKVPADRFQSAGEFARALEAAAPSTMYSRKKSPVLLALAGAAAVVLIVLATLFAKKQLAGTSGPAAVLRDRAVITNTGRVRFPAISGDGKTLAYGVSNCTPRGCTYGIELQDVDGSASRRLFDGATALYGIRWSPDRRNLLLIGTINTVYGSFLISALGGNTRRVGTNMTSFFSGGDSLISARGIAPGDVHWLFISGLDGVARDSISVKMPADGITKVLGVPNSPWFVVALSEGREAKWISLDRTGKIGGTITTDPSSDATTRMATDALWLGLAMPTSAVITTVRIPFDSRDGTFGRQTDTLSTGSPTSIDVTADGTALVFDEGTAQYSGWALDLADALKGDFPEQKRLFAATSPFDLRLSPDGQNVLVRQASGAQSTEGRRVTIVPFTGGPETLVAATALQSFWVDAKTVAISTRSQGGTEFSLVDVNTRARRSRLTVPDSAIVDFTMLSGNTWVWIPSLHDLNIRVHGPAPLGERSFKLPSWYSRAYVVSGNESPDGRKILVTGWSAPSEDSLGVSVLDVNTGVFTQLVTAYAENGYARWLADGSIALVQFETQESASVSRITPDGHTVRIGTFPRAVAAVFLSSDAKRAAVVLRDFHGDAWMAHVAKTK
jgi:tRNA A-37 threonylcarbamoyl transferase component Bud32